MHAKSDAAKKATYAELIGGRYFNVQLEWNKQMGNLLYAPGKASRRTRRTTRSSASRSRARTSRPRSTAQEDFCTDVKVPGMVHGRMIRPAVAGACR